MAPKATYIYRVEMGRNGEVLQKEFCYARNAVYAVDGMRKEYDSYTNYNAIPVGDVDINLHPGFYERVSQEEDAYLKTHRCTTGEKYSMRKKVAG